MRSEDDALNVLIVDDEPAVHDITALVLKNFRYKGYKLQLRSAYSASEARQILSSEGPFALILLDVIMETDDAGLKLARYIREELKDPMVRIILRTGQPGMVPQRHVMREFEIDDYKEKAELTSERFDATVTSSIRTYLGFLRLEENRQGLIRILEAVSNVDSGGMDEEPAIHILSQIEAVINRSDAPGLGSLLISGSGHGRENIIAGHGTLAHLHGKSLLDMNETGAVNGIREAIRTGRTRHDGRRIMMSLKPRNGISYLVYFEDIHEFGDTDRCLMELYTSHINVSFDNKILNRELVDTQKEIIATLGEVIETSSGKTGRHVQRVGEISRLLAEGAGMSHQEREFILLAAPLHDIGKVGISDAILNKPGRLTEDEYGIVKNHARIGYDILKYSKRPVLQMGARICLEHHERWDGRGYPNGLAGEEISLEARICSIADVLDALRSKRVYKDAMSLEESLEIVAKGRGTRFDPNLVDLLLAGFDELQAIYDAHGD